ncbi:ABC transporter ATP-binding protein [Nocardioides soli]|uniref:NitT/TauT family transport system ATP-binding protein n=1 Tax=Nocardioides soli TaxID=1036020 RepID=A0A7W4YZ93_9ACTN|nr:ABC transporter ATP-binding protein [Nocardioides soli]MBB3040727.1 NitT/TauT family transport system ATP-binding protein [Nocardioides soli]
MHSQPTTDTKVAEPTTETVPMLRVDGLSKQYRSKHGKVQAIEQIDLAVHPGEFVSIVGPSGCGKTTLLNCLSGLIQPTTGELALDGRAYSSPPEELSIVFQDYSRSLFPWMSVEQNIAVPIRDSSSKAERRESVYRLLAQVGLPEKTGPMYPWQLSGGMQQRVAIARALVSRPKVLLMDEPFASVDAQTRNVLEDLVLNVWQEWNKTIIFVTHDIDEAVYLSDRIVVLSGSPASTIADLEVPISRPRDQLLSKQDPRFGEIRAELYELIMGAHKVDREAS